MREISLSIPADHPAFAGHFPGHPLLPGVALLTEVLEAVLDDPELAALVGPAPRIAAAKFLAPVRPGAQLSLQLDGGPRGVRFEIRERERIAASGQFEASGGPSAGPPQAGPYPKGHEGAPSGPRGSIAVLGDRGAP